MTIFKCPNEKIGYCIFQNGSMKLSSHHSQTFRWINRSLYISKKCSVLNNSFQKSGWNSGSSKISKLCIRLMFGYFQTSGHKNWFSNISKWYSETKFRPFLNIPWRNGLLEIFKILPWGWTWLFSDFQKMGYQIYQNGALRLILAFFRWLDENKGPQTSENGSLRYNPG